MRRCKLITENNGNHKFQSLIDEEIGPLKCWRNPWRCTSNCVAWDLSHLKVRCMALPKNKNASNVIAYLKKEKK